MDKNIRWLLTEIDRWKAEGLVSPEQGDRIRQRYAQPPAPAAESVPWGLLVFATAGAIVIGLGVILLFAYNWDEIPKPGKLALVFGAVIAAHLAGARLLAKDGWQPKLGEALAALGTMFYGAGIWLVAQIYNIDEHYPNGFLFWALGALAMAWALRSVANGLLAIVLVVIWGSCEAFDFRAPQYWSILLIAGGLVPLAWQQRSALLLAAALALPALAHAADDSPIPRGPSVNERLTSARKAIDAKGEPVQLVNGATRAVDSPTLFVQDISATPRRGSATPCVNRALRAALT